jgi:ring-1,2-phenylacetyl-CoA epoxidase subunit PaaC
MTSLGVSAAAQEYLLALADDEHLIGQQHAEWIGVAPFLEEDLAFCSIAQDELGHAAMLYELIGDADQLAYGRRPGDYRCCHLVEVPCRDWAEALARHWLYDLAEVRRWSALAESTLGAVAAIVDRAVREEEYHRRHAATLIDRMLGSPHDEAAQRAEAAIIGLLPLADAVWDPVAGEPEALADGVASASSAELQRAWRRDVEDVLGAVDWHPLERPDQAARTRRSPYFAPLQERITEVFRLDPSARW